MTLQEIIAFYKLLGLNKEQLPKQVALEPTQFADAEKPHVQYVIRLSGDTKPPQPVDNPSA